MGKALYRALCRALSRVLCKAYREFKKEVYLWLQVSSSYIIDNTQLKKCGSSSSFSCACNKVDKAI